MLLIQMDLKLPFNLNQIFVGLLTNCDTPTKINKPTTSILAQDILTFKPSALLNAFTLKELVETSKLLGSQGYEVKTIKEIIPNHHDLGIVRELFISVNDFETKRPFTKTYRYYLIFINNLGETLLLTYNPEVKNKKQLTVALDKETKVSCQILTTKDLENHTLVLKNKVLNEIGTYYAYEASVNEEV